jgi:hypothetical protein
MTREFLVRVKSAKPIDRLQLLRVLLGMERLGAAVDRIEVQSVEPEPAFGLHHKGRLQPLDVHGGKQ